MDGKLREGVGKALLSKINAKAQRKHGLERVFDGNLQVLKVGLSYSSSEMLSKINAEKPLNQSQFEDVPGRLLWISELFWTGMGMVGNGGNGVNS
jgi:hypothetical protein